jgi:peptidoglycan/LPS O-acetylase OafA/YrhL
MVFTWHFIHGQSGYPVPYESAPTIFPLVVFDEGHTGVALFMVLSGYLFAKLLDGKAISYSAFFWNRFFRLAPLLVLVLSLLGIEKAWHGELLSYLKLLAYGLVVPRWPNGGWSVAIEIHFYIALPLLLWFTRRWSGSPLIAIVGAIAARCAIWAAGGDVEYAAYWTIVGRADDFLWGIAAFGLRDFITPRHFFVASIAIMFTAVFWLFDHSGGFYDIGAANPVWIIWPTLEGASYGIIIAYYDSRPQSSTAISRFSAELGKYSYSIYLLHPFLVFKMSDFVQERLMDISNFYVALAWSSICFIVIFPIGFISYRYLESPFLRLRKNYVRQQKDAEPNLDVRTPNFIAAEIVH